MPFGRLPLKHNFNTLLLHLSDRKFRSRLLCVPFIQYAQWNILHICIGLGLTIFCRNIIRGRLTKYN